jgi:hypothetical protein
MYAISITTNRPLKNNEKYWHVSSFSTYVKVKGRLPHTMLNTLYTMYNLTYTCYIWCWKWPPALRNTEHLVRKFLITVRISCLQVVNTRLMMKRLLYDTHPQLRKWSIGYMYLIILHTQSKLNAAWETCEVQCTSDLFMSKQYILTVCFLW